MRVTIIHNPTSGDAPLSAPALRAMCEAAGHRVSYASTEGPWERAIREPADLVVAAGGDGTVRKVALAVAGTGTPFGILPVGTANNVAKTLGIMGPLEAIVRGWQRRRVRAFDVALASAARDDERFVEGFGGGLFAELVRQGRVQEEERSPYAGRSTDRALHLFRTIVERAEPGRWDLTLDGTDLSGTYLAVEALNTRFGGPNIPLAPAARAGDGLLDVVLVPSRDRSRLLAYLERRLELGSGELPALPVHRGRHLRAVPPPGAALHLDDRPWPEEARPGHARRSGAAGRRLDRMVDVLLRPGAARVASAR